ncbi:MAG TPA: DUF4224 domain-containing protein [Nevskiaceae bacterium]|nr:DUF4224 domain-containing protein [Nevskiaceae bacterium]
MESAIVQEEELLKSTGFEKRGWLENWLREQGIEYFRGKDGRVFTTVGLLEAAKQRGARGSSQSIRF